MKIRRIQLDSVKVPARPDSINSPEFDKPLHMLAYGGKTEWSLQFDEIPKWIIQLTLDDGTVGLGESYRGLPADTMKSFAETLVGLDLIGQWRMPHVRQRRGRTWATIASSSNARPKILWWIGARR